MGSNLTYARGPAMYSSHPIEERWLGSIGLQIWPKVHSMKKEMCFPKRRHNTHDTIRRSVEASYNSVSRRPSAPSKLVHEIFQEDNTTHTTEFKEALKSLTIACRGAPLRRQNSCRKYSDKITRHTRHNSPRRGRFLRWLKRIDASQ